jgi:tRNA(fMet)-specific endonuclease VapC
MDKALVDTDIFSEILKGIDQNVVAKATAYLALFGRYTISTITVMEIVKAFTKRDVRNGYNSSSRDYPRWNF